MNDNTTRTCTKCGNSFPATTEYFHERKDSPIGLRSLCKDCERERKRIDANRRYQDKLKHDPEYMQNARDKANKWREENPELSKQRARDYAASHREEAKVRAKQWAKDNPERVKQLGRETHKRLKADPERYERVKAYSRQYIKDNVEKKRTWTRNRRALLLNAPGTHTAADIERLYAEQEGRCLYCGITLFDDYHVDHMTPVSRGGANDASNLAITCSDCNQSKSDKTVEEWQGVRGW